jgi:hypothetical protein
MSASNTAHNAVIQSRKSLAVSRLLSQPSPLLLSCPHFSNLPLFYYPSLASQASPYSSILPSLPKLPHQLCQPRLRRSRRHLLLESTLPTTRLLRAHRRRRRRRRIRSQLNSTRRLVRIHLGRSGRRHVSRRCIAVVHGRRLRPRAVCAGPVGRLLLLLVCVGLVCIVRVLVLHRLAVALSFLVGNQPLFPLPLARHTTEGRKS